MTPNEERDITRLGRAILADQPLSVLLGASFRLLEPGKAILELPIRKDLLQQRGVVHGGVLSYLSDNALTFAGGSILGSSVATLEMKINYLRPARSGTLVAVATVISAGSRTAVAMCQISVENDDSTEELVAVAQGTIITITK